jgi:hypothetical protein
MGAADLAKLHTKDFDVLILYSREWPVNPRLLQIPAARWVLESYLNLDLNATSDEVRSALGFVPVQRWTRRGQWIEIYVPEK